ncbi:putative bifunctional diguanylate cyclase/phosphodiesterase [Sphingomonas sp. Sphisp140]|uniref:putative bifunctional diguanylate cyclase/phosphodiesterase n=1 Tax=unclassified Sphingomonas TaxID=196159 RepID=UPI0039AF6D90
MALRDIGVVLAAMAALTYCAFAFDIFENEPGIGIRQAEIELDEALLLGICLGAGLLLFGISQYVRQRREMSKRLAAEREVRKLAYQDVLTGLPNRRKFEDALDAAIHAPPRAGAAHAVFLIDLNGFKSVNDIHGHGAGDALLLVVAQRLLAAMRDGDIVARFGGDEFAILATHLADPEAAANIALRVIEALDEPVNAAGASHRVGAGIGIALMPTDAATAEELLRKADVALYRAKAERRSALRFFEPAMDARLQERAALEAGLRTALDENRIEIALRPTRDLRTHAVTGFDAAPRWLDPRNAGIAPERFLAIAEEVGLIHALGERILRLGCAAARAWPEQVTLGVSLHASQLRDHLLAARFLRILGEAGIAPSRLEVAITESAFVADLDNARSSLGALQNAGIRIALDNFGTGYSSLYHLRNFRLDKVKIDRSFVQAMTEERESASIVRALIGLGRGLGFTVAAEGIIASDQEGALLGTGCEQGQGDLLGTPLGAEEAAALFPQARIGQAG